MVKTGQNLDLNKIDFSFIPSLRCNLRCSFCMYDASPDNDLELSFTNVKTWLNTVEWDKIGSWGFYGGEPSIDTPNYDRFMDLIPNNVPKFIITNGAWSSSIHATLDWWEFCNKRAGSGDKLNIVISGTPEHKKYQRASLIERISKWEGVTVKGDDDIHPMGRAIKDNWECTQKCIWHEQPIRLGILPTGDIILQNCDGVYPVIGTYKQSFSVLHLKAIQMRKVSCFKIHKNVNDVLEVNNVPNDK